MIIEAAEWERLSFDQKQAGPSLEPPHLNPSTACLIHMNTREDKFRSDLVVKRLQDHSALTSFSVRESPAAHG
jgi:hypothetical protein